MSKYESILAVSLVTLFFQNGEGYSQVFNTVNKGLVNTDKISFLLEISDWPVQLFRRNFGFGLGFSKELQLNKQMLMDELSKSL